MKKRTVPMTGAALFLIRLMDIRSYLGGQLSGYQPMSMMHGASVTAFLCRHILWSTLVRRLFRRLQNHVSPHHVAVPIFFASDVTHVHSKIAREDSAIRDQYDLLAKRRMGEFKISAMVEYCDNNEIRVSDQTESNYNVDQTFHSSWQAVARIVPVCFRGRFLIVSARRLVYTW